MEKFAIVAVSIFTMYFLTGIVTRQWARFAAGIELLGYFDNPEYDPNEERFSTTLKRLEHERRVPRWWVLGASFVLVIMTSGVLVSITELSQVLNACLALLGGGLVVNIVLYVAEQFVADALRKKLIDRYAIKLANPQY